MIVEIMVREAIASLRDAIEQYDKGITNCAKLIVRSNTVKEKIRWAEVIGETLERRREAFISINALKQCQHKHTKQYERVRVGIRGRG